MSIVGHQHEGMRFKTQRNMLRTSKSRSRLQKCLWTTSRKRRSLLSTWLVGTALLPSHAPPATLLGPLAHWLMRLVPVLVPCADSRVGWQRGLGEMSKAVKVNDFEEVKLLLEIGGCAATDCSLLMARCGLMATILVHDQQARVIRMSWTSSPAPHPSTTR